MKKAIAVVMLILVAALTLGACGGKSASGKSGTAYEGKWKCEEIPSGVSFKSVKLELADGKFTYTLDNTTNKTVTEGYYKGTGNTSFVLYAEKQIGYKGNSAVHEKTLESSESIKQAVYGKVEDNGKTLVLQNKDTPMNFVRDN